MGRFWGAELLPPPVVGCQATPGLRFGKAICHLDYRKRASRCGHAEAYITDDLLVIGP